MFGHDDNTTEDVNTTPAESDVVTPTPPEDATATPAGDNTTTAPVTTDDQTTTEPATATDEPAAETPAPETAAEEVPVVTPDVPADTTTPETAPVADPNSLLSLKQEALQKLTPLVGHLDQPAEEKFRTTMMMIQAADDSTLVQTAYDAALQIEDEKVRAQALLDIVNEINYFTQSKTTEPTA